MCLLPFYVLLVKPITEIAYSDRVKRETDLPVRLLEKFTYSNNEFFVYHIDTQVITQRKCIQNRRFYKHISYVAAWTSINLQETSARTTVTHKKRIKRPKSPEKCNMIVLQASTLTQILRSRGRSRARCGHGSCTWGRGRASWCDWETRWAWSTALWTAWDTAEAIDLDISSDIVCEFPVSETEIVMWLVTCSGTYHVVLS